jgi:transcription-repair coupling factor (superfamily II helicase)
MQKTEEETILDLQQVAQQFATTVREESLQKLLADKDIKRISLSGLAGSAIALLLSGIKRGKQPILVIADDPDDAGYIYHDLSKIAGEDAVKIFPSGYRRDIKYGQTDAPSVILRTEVLNTWHNKTTRWVIASPEALAEKVPQENKLSCSTLQLSLSTKIKMSEAKKRLADMGFKPVDYVYEPGQYAVRGSILDVFSFAGELPYRIDFFDDEIESIRTFDVETQLSVDTPDSISIIPDLQSSKNDEAGISFLEFITADTPVFCRSLKFALSRIEEISHSKAAPAISIAEEGDAEALKNVVDYDEFKRQFDDFKVIEFGVSPTINNPQATLTFECSPQSLYHKNFNLISDSFTRFINDGYKIFILSDSAHQTDRLKAIFEDRKDDIKFTPVLNTIHEGFTDHIARICYFTDHQIFDRFHKYNLKSDRARSGKLALSLKELGKLEVGDYVVHTDHGIGRFAGLMRTDVSGKTQEMIKLLYTNDDIIFVSIHSLHKLSKYRGQEGVPPKLSKLGSGAWNRLKERTKKKVKDIARDLIKLYAARREQKGFSFSPDTYMQHELEASFIYEDTPDQLKAVEAVKKDMEAPLPMDRLICGDVGFGKTEIAIRAAFKAAADGKQTAVLVPTTVLALQHYHTFSERLKDMPVRVDFISRARKAKDVKQILKDLEEGKIDILVGTHKIIGKDVKFKDLGLLVIDEEQKFGVAVKEKLKQLKVNVDTLTMSATPIPRTLQFSLMGARDLSNLNTPPANRRPIATTVSPMNDEIVAEAVKFELSRNGQLFFICNRIERMATISNMLHRLVPDARIVEGHGQMPPEKLEQAICDFSNHDYDILLATTIVENGIDMPNVNTILVDNAQNFGLSELHQLRGRVGRSDRKGFCYLFVPPGIPLTTVARRRLQAIESFSGLGAGIHIAMQDLDIRGAGNLLGAEQSGFIADLGYEAYQKILKESVLELRTEEFADTFKEDVDKSNAELVADCTIESDLELLIPASYVPQESERINLYRQLDNMEQPEETETFRAAMRDRFGRIPDETEQLIRIVPLRRIAKTLGIERLNLKGGKMYLYFVGAENEAYYNSAAFGRVVAYMQSEAKRCKPRDINGKRSILIDDVKTVTEALEILQTISATPAI